MRPKIVRVWGTADLFDIEFTHCGGMEWQCSIPPDTSDGVYAVEIFAMNILSETAHWCGELFMCNGVCHLKLTTSKYLFWFKPQKLSLKITTPKHLILRKRCTTYEH